MEIRLHGRGGQGGVTCAKILATTYAEVGKSVQAFGDYAGERSGAPIRAYARVSDNPITNRNKVYEPHHLLVLDPTLLSPAVVAGLRPGGYLLVNSPEPPEHFAGAFPGIRVATVDATDIARRHGIGSRSVVIVNTTIAGAYMRLVGMPFSALQDAYARLGLAANTAAAQEAWDSVRVLEQVAEAPVAAGGPVAAASPWGATVAGDVQPLTEHFEGPAPTLKTGAWRSSTPVFSGRMAPCAVACPAGNDVAGFVQALHRDGPAAAAEILARTTPFAATCGRVCPGFCKAACNRAEYDGSVDTRGLERWVADHAPIARRGAFTTASPKRVAIVGGGPAGLSAAYQLARAGHRVVVYEKGAELGGLLRTGIPPYRLPRDVLDQEIDGILALGVVARFGSTVTQETIQELAATYDAVIVSTGLQDTRSLRIEGSDLPGVHQGLDFLEWRNAGEVERLNDHVVVLGGGNTAIDCARSALRSGASSVTVAYRRTRAEMPAIAEEVDEAIEEGVRFLFQRSPTAFFGNFRVEGMELAEVEMGAPDDSGRRRPVVTDRSEILQCDNVLLALGTGADRSLIPTGWELQGGRLWCEGQAMPVFAAGDVSTYDGTVAHAIGDGRKAALAVMQDFGDDVAAMRRPSESVNGEGPSVVGTSDLRFGHFPNQVPAQREHLPVAERLETMAEVSQGLSDASEAARCLSCAICTSCDTCLVYCPEGSVLRDGRGYLFDLDICKGCGICATECPRGCIEMVST